VADHVGACAAVLMPIFYELIKAHVFAAGRVHGRHATVPVLAKSKTRIGRLWTYVRDDKPFWRSRSAVAAPSTRTASPCRLSMVAWPI
jgi:transposase